MLKRVPPDEPEQDQSSLLNSRTAVQYLYEESLANGNADITLILAEALTCGDALIAGKHEISYRSRDALLYLYFLRAIIGLPPKKIGHLVALLKWLEIIPRDSETGKTGFIRKRPKVE
jgi:hypothetical protein